MEFIINKSPEPKSLKNCIRHVSKDLSKDPHVFHGTVLRDKGLKTFFLTVLLISIFSNAHTHASPHRNMLDQKFEKAQEIDESVESGPKEKADAWWSFINFLTMHVNIEKLKQSNIYEYRLFKFAEKRLKYWKAHGEAKELVVNDTKNEVQWVMGPDADMNWSEACAWVKNLSIDGGGWRMPTRSELRGLFSFAYFTERNIPDSFETTGWFIWSGDKKAPIYAFFINLKTGIIQSQTHDTSMDFRTFAVRNSKKRLDEHNTHGRCIY
jgi:hypothetical protein